MTVSVYKVEPQTSPVAFYDSPDPVGVFVRAIQDTVGAVSTGSWDKETHNLLSAWIIATADKIGRDVPGLPVWGVDPVETASVVKSLVPEKIMPIWLFGGGQIAAGLGLPQDMGDCALQLERDAAKVTNAMAAVADHITRVELDVPRSQLPGGQEQPHVPSTTDVWGNPQGVQPSGSSVSGRGFPTGLAVAVGLVASGITGLVLLRRT